MKNQILDMIRGMSQMDISIAPNYKTMLAIGRHPEAYFPNPMQTAASIKINVNEEFVGDHELFQPAVDAYVKTLSRIYDQLKKDMNTAVADKVFAIMAKDMTLTYTF